MHQFHPGVIKKRHSVIITIIRRAVAQLKKKSNVDLKQQQDQRASQPEASKYDLGLMDNGCYKIPESIIKMYRCYHTGQVA